MKKPLYFEMPVETATVFTSGKSVKRLTLLALCLVSFVQINAQTSETNSFKRNEIKLDVAYILGGAVKVEYEHLFNNWHSAGLVALVNTPSTVLLRFITHADRIEEPTYQTQFLAFYRLYPGNKPAAGFFMEVNAGISSGYWSDPTKGPPAEKYTAFGVGIALGWKHVTNSNFTWDFVIGLGTFDQDSCPGLYPRLGICLGKRF